MDQPLGNEHRQSSGRPSVFTDPDGYMRDFENRMAAVRERAEHAQTLMNDTSVRLESEEREVAVTVNIGGALVGLEFGPAARSISGPALAAMVMETYNEAAAEASRRSVDVMSDLLGDESEAMTLVRRTINRYAPEED